MNTLTDSETNDAVTNVQEFFSVLMGSDSAPDMLPIFPIETDEFVGKIGDLAGNSFPDSLSTLASLEEGAHSDVTIQSLGSNRNIGVFIIKAFRKTICANASVSKEIKAALDEAKKQGATVATPTAAGITSQAAVAVTIAILSGFSGPVAVAIAPLAGGVALLMMQVGIEGFCMWSAEVGD